MEAPRANVSTKAPFHQNWLTSSTWNKTLDGTVSAKMFPIGNVASDPLSSLQQGVDPVPFAILRSVYAARSSWPQRRARHHFPQRLPDHRQHQQRRAEEDQRRHQRIAE